jgi:hypothetical protein
VDDTDSVKVRQVTLVSCFTTFHLSQKAKKLLSLYFSISMYIWGMWAEDEQKMTLYLPPKLGLL